MSQNSRRVFIKGALAVGSGLAVSAAFAGSSKRAAKDKGGVSSGKSCKKEVLYKRTQNWDEFYSKAL